MASEEERAAITATARRTGLPVAAAMAALAEGGRPAQRADWREGIDRIARCSGLLEELADALSEEADPEKRRRLRGKLGAIAADIAEIARPWLAGRRAGDKDAA